MLEIKSLTVSYETGSSLSFRKRKIRAVEDVDLMISHGEIHGLVGESGCGKSTLGRAILGLVKVEKGSIFFEEKPLHLFSRRDWKKIRRDIQVVFQDPFSSLNPRLTIEEIITEGLYVHYPRLTKYEKKKKALDILDRVNLPSNSLERYPHEFSGGQRQRIAIARALVLNPKFVILDEAVSALDISTQAAVLNLLMDLKKEFNLSYLFISHDLGIVRYMSDKISIMYLGKIVETGCKKDIIEFPSHPYTKALFDSAFDLSIRRKPKISIKGEIPSAVNKPSGCIFHTRCPIVQDICRLQIPKVAKDRYGKVVHCNFPLDKTHASSP